MFQSVIQFFTNIFSPILPTAWIGRNKRTRDEDAIDVDDPPIKKFRMNPQEGSSSSSYFPNPFFSRTREKCSQTSEVIDLDPTPLVETISLLDETSSVSDKENLTSVSPSKSISSNKNKYKPPAHCRSPLKSKFKHVSRRRSSDDVLFVDSYTKNPSDSTDLLASSNASRPIFKRINSSQKSPFSLRTQRIMGLSSRSKDFYPTPGIIDFQSRMKYGELLGKVLKSPEMFSCTASSGRSFASTQKVIDLTEDEPSTSKYSSKVDNQSKLSDQVIDLTGPLGTKPSISETINLDSDVGPVNKFVGHRKIVSPVNTLSRQLKHYPCTSSNYVSNLVKEIEIFKKDFARDQEKLSKELSDMSPLRKNFEKALEQRLKRHLKITTIDLDEEEEEEEPVKPQLTPDMISAVMNAWDPRKPKSQVLVSNFNYQIKRSDLQTLSGLNWLNDEVINFYMELIMNRGKEKDFPSVHAFSTFFYPKLEKDGYSSLRRWTRKVDIFSFDIIVVPIHLRVHWCLAIIDMKKRTITYYDSMGQPNSTCINSLLRYLSEEHMDKKKEPYDTSDWELLSTKDTVPQQMNSCDCGVFACTFAEYATREAKHNFSQEDMPYFRRKMTYEILNSALLIWN